MGVLTDSMSRLRDEIVAGRRSRQALRSELARLANARQCGVAALRRAVARDLAGARRAWAGVAAQGEEAGPARRSQPERAPAAPGAFAAFKKRKKR